MARRNQAILAERLRWPEGALQACRDLEDRYPGWRVDWLGENRRPGFERPGGFLAANEEDVRHKVEAFRTDLAEIEAVLAAGVPAHAPHPQLCMWCLHHPERPAKI